MFDSEHSAQRIGLPWRQLALSWGFLVLAAAGYLCAFAGKTPERAETTRNELLHVSPESLDFGRVASSREFRWNLPITNVSTQVVRVVDFETSCGCTKIAPRSFELQPGETTHLELAIDLSGASTGTSSFSAQLGPILEHADKPHVAWKVIGEVITPCTLDTHVLFFSGSAALVQGEESPVLSILATLADSRLSLEAVTNNGMDAIDIQPGDSNGVAIVRITPSSRRPVGWFESPLTLHVLDVDRAVLGVLDVVVKGEVLAPLDISPKQLAIGAIPIGTKINREFTVSHKSGSLVDVRSDSDDVEIRIEKRNAATSIVFVSLNAERSGEQSKRIELIYLTDNGEPQMATTYVRYWGYPLE